MASYKQHWGEPGHPNHLPMVEAIHHCIALTGMENLIRRLLDTPRDFRLKRRSSQISAIDDSSSLIDLVKNNQTARVSMSDALEVFNNVHRVNTTGLEEGNTSEDTNYVNIHPRVLHEDSRLHQFCE